LNRLWKYITISVILALLTACKPVSIASAVPAAGATSPSASAAVTAVSPPSSTVQAIRQPAPSTPDAIAKPTPTSAISTSASINPSATQSASPAVSPSPSASASTFSGFIPIVQITQPLDESILPEGDVTVSVVISFFNIVDKLGKSNIQGEGHLVYYLDVEPPTGPGQPALSASGTSADVAKTSYTWQNVKAGLHLLSVQLVNNDDSPLIPPVTNAEFITVVAAVSATPSPLPSATP
jgi:hypothetical protein